MSNFIQQVSEDVNFEINNFDSLSSWIVRTAENENKQVGPITLVFCSDEKLHTYNVEFLNHDTYTDVITFDYSEGDTISGDILISIDRIQENAEAFKVPFNHELNRVIIHGVLHLIGYKDKTPEDQQTMKSKEDFYLNLQLK